MICATHTVLMVLRINVPGMIAFEGFFAHCSSGVRHARVLVKKTAANRAAKTWNVFILM